MRDQGAWRSRKAAPRDSVAHQSTAGRLHPEEAQKTLPLSCPRSQWCRVDVASRLEIFHLSRRGTKSVFLSLPAERIFERRTAPRGKKRIARKCSQIIWRQKAIFGLALRFHTA